MKLESGGFRGFRKARKRMAKTLRPLILAAFHRHSSAPPAWLVAMLSFVQPQFGAIPERHSPNSRRRLTRAENKTVVPIRPSSRKQQPAAAVHRRFEANFSRLIETTET